MYHYGLGVEQNYKKAIELYTLSADQGCMSAQNNLGHMYNNGLGVDEDMLVAFKYFKQSMDQVNDNAKQYLIKLTKDNPKIII